jgi:hypothetical protein
MIRRPDVAIDSDGFPVGWCFDSFSWKFHRALWAEHGVRLEFGEFSHIKRQCRRGGEKLAERVWRVTLRRGLSLVIGVTVRWPQLPARVLSEENWPAWVELQQAQADARKAAEKTRRAAV